MLNETPEDQTPEDENDPLWHRALQQVGRVVGLLDRPAMALPKFARRATFLTLLVLSAMFGAMVGLMLVYSVNLPQMDDLIRYRPNTTTELYDVHGKIVGSFALERRVVVSYSDIPPVLRQAVISIEDKSFERNSGVNLIRAAEAAYTDVHSKGRAQGASTLTMQLARNLFLSAQKTYGRKAQEILLALQIERRFTKDQIFELYANQIYLGHGTYGFEAGAEFYFSKHVRDLTLPEAAMLAALPKGPEAYSPIKYPERALRRRNLVISEMLSDGKITENQAEAAKGSPLGLHLEPPPNSIAPYFVEEVRRQLEKEYGVEEVHGAGLRVYTTLDLDLQRVANQATLDGAAAYERRHGWKGRLPNIVLAGEDMGVYKHPDWTQPVAKGGYFHALVTSVEPKRVTVKIGAQTATMVPADWLWVQRPDASSFLRNGDVIYVRVDSTPTTEPLHVVLEQDSGAQVSMMAVDNSSGEVLAMVGGRDFALSQFNRATQAQRQVGSSFKPYVYSTAIENGMKPSDTVVDAPTTFPTPNGPYTPHNYEADYKGTMTLLTAFAESRNIPALRLADKFGIRKVIEMAHRFGVTSEIQPFLPVAIGSADISLYDQVGAYTVFPNDGIRIEPHYIRKVTQADGLPLPETMPKVTEVISLGVARQMMQLLQAVTQFGTGAAAASLKHPFGGKTGTTNDYTDAWFIGFSPSITCGTWIGFDDPHQSLGEKETGARAALPMWMDFMKVAIAPHPNETFPTANAPKKQLDVPMPHFPQDESVLKPSPPADEPDPDAEDNAPASAKPGPAAKPAATPAPAAPAPSAPATPSAPAPPPMLQQPPAPVVRQSPPANPPAAGAP